MPIQSAAVAPAAAALAVAIAPAVRVTGLVCEANYAVFRTKLSQPSTVFNVGRYLDVVVRTPDGLKFSERQAIYDTEMVPNSIIYPI